MKKSVSCFIIILFFILASCTPASQSNSQQETQTANAVPQSTPTIPTSTPKPTPTSTPNPLLQISPEELNGLKIYFWHPYSGDLSDSLESMIREFNSNNAWGIQVITTSFGSAAGMADSFTENLESRDFPNVVLASSEQNLLWENRYQVFVDLNQYILDSQWGLSEEEKTDIPQTYWDQDSIKDVQVGMPALRDMHLLFYNKTWAKELGYTKSPDTFDIFTDQICAAASKRKEIDETGGYISNTDALTIYSWLAAAGVTELYDPELNVYQFDTTEVLSVMTDLKALAVEGCIWNARLPEPYDYFANHQTLMYSGTLPDIISQTKAMKDLENKDEWLIQPYPSDEKNSEVVTNGSSYVILETTPAEQLASWLFLRWLILPRNQASLSSASGYLPVSDSTYGEMKSFIQSYPQWETVMEWGPSIISAPNTGSWTMVQYLLEDASWQVFQTYTTQKDLQGLMKQLDDMIPEVLAENEIK